MKNHIGEILLGVLILTLVVIFAFFPSQKKTLGIIDPKVEGTNTSIVASTTVSLAMAVSTGDVYRSFGNTGSNTIYISKMSTSTGFTAGTGFPLFAGQVSEMTDADGTLWTGNVWVITTSGTSSLSMARK